MKRLGCRLASLALLLLTACSKPAVSSERKETDVAAEPLERESAVVPQAARADSPQERWAAQKKMEARLAEFGERLKALKAKAETAGGKAKAEINDMIKDLEKKMAVARQQLQKFQSASADAWEQARSRMAAAMDDLQKAYDRAAERLKKSV